LLLDTLKGNHGLAKESLYLARFYRCVDLKEFRFALVSRKALRSNGPIKRVGIECDAHFSSLMATSNINMSISVKQGRFMVPRPNGFRPRFLLA
jgi:hypothetical protein